MYSDGHEVDGSWVLRVYVTDLQVERSLRVKGELHIGGVMLRLVEDLGEFSVFFSIVFRRSCFVVCFFFIFDPVMHYCVTQLRKIYASIRSRCLINTYHLKLPISAK